MKNKMPQNQFKRGTAPQQPVMPHSMDNREAGSPTAQRKRNSVALGFQTQARPGLSGLLSHRTKSGRGK
jgi:hypothetical protein